MTGSTRADIAAPRGAEAGKRPPISWDIPGFAPMTRIATTFGDVPAQALRERDMVRTRSGEYLRIEWLDRIVLNEDFMQRHSDANPVLIRANAFGAGLPLKDVLLSPGQHVCGDTRGMSGRFRPARALTGQPNIMRKPEPIITYTVFHCGKPAVVKTEGIWAQVTP